MKNGGGRRRDTMKLKRVRDLFLYNPAPMETEFELAPSPAQCAPADSDPVRTVSVKVQDNLTYVRQVFGVPENFDFIIREFKVMFGDGYADAFLIFYDGMSDKNIINRDILRSLITNGTSDVMTDDIVQTVYRKIVAQAPLSMEANFEKIVQQVEFGCCAIFVQGCNCAFVADVKGWKGRGVNAPSNEASLTGPQEAFNETIMTNLALIRKILKDADLMAENIPVGTKSKTPCGLLYLRGITNESLVAEVRRRLKLIDVEYVFSSADIEMLIEDSTFLPMPHILKTERPDRAASMLAEGKVVVIVQGSPFVLVLPTTAADLLEASEDNYVRVPEANFMKAVRLFGIFLSVFLPASFIAVALYHHEVFPTDLLMAIEATREKVPFPIVLELLIMEFGFELIKEASVRIPNPVGSTIGIIGALILGQAAVSANLVSPILIIIVAAAGVGSFATPSMALSRALSILRFLYILLGAVGGFLGIACGIFINGVMLAGVNMLGVPFLSPFTPRGARAASGALFVRPVWKKEKRPAALKTQAEDRQPPISRRWADTENEAE